MPITDIMGQVGHLGLGISVCIILEPDCALNQTRKFSQSGLLASVDVGSLNSSLSTVYLVAYDEANSSNISRSPVRR